MHGREREPGGAHRWIEDPRGRRDPRPLLQRTPHQRLLARAPDPRPVWTDRGLPTSAWRGRDRDGGPAPPASLVWPGPGPRAPIRTPPRPGPRHRRTHRREPGADAAGGGARAAPGGLVAATRSLPVADPGGRAPGEGSPGEGP